MRGRQVQEYYVFIASPSDVAAERDLVRVYFDNFNRTTGLEWQVRFQVIDWENFSTAGIGRPQALITKQTLERFRADLILVIVIIAQRFGTPSGEAESGTEEEVRWALNSNIKSGFPEMKCFFRDIEQFVAPPDPDRIAEAVEQWGRVIRFRREIETGRYMLVKTYAGPESFESVFRKDLEIWLHAEDRPWTQARSEIPPRLSGRHEAPTEYFQDLVRSYQWLDIIGIDSDRAFKLPLTEIYVRLRVILNDDRDNDKSVQDFASVNIQTALQRYIRLVVVGDPGSGKSTFLRFIALTLAKCVLLDDPQPAAEKLLLSAPLPIPIFLSCWDFSEYLKKETRGHINVVIRFIARCLRDTGWPISDADLERLLINDVCVLLIDGLDEVPTEQGRHLVSHLIEEFVEKYHGNRYVVTSRVRAYAGEAILAQGFTRCDIQPFAKEERDLFLENWVKQLFKMRGHFGSIEPAATTELSALSEAIETSSIRSLAVNPLLLTVIAIVHWNRKRLPEQRVDLYDECIDVLLGQRKQAEQQRTSRDTRVLNEIYSEERLDQQTWVRKRFAEIAFAILSRGAEDIDRATVVELLEKHFQTIAAREGSRVKAERFLDRQELYSGLFVRRRLASYRFAHLTFQEYLAAWFLANRDLASTLETVLPYLRDPKWFETLQLLAGELANRSDEYLDRYIACLLDNVGKTIREQAPVMALCANVIRDTQAVAEVRTQTHRRYKRLLRGTLGAFVPSSRVSKQTQLDLLEALARLGASVKSHLISATGSRLPEVRKHAVEILVPHLSDDDLFSMTHLLADPSKEPVIAYISAIVERDRVRAGQLILNLSNYGEETFDALFETAPPKLPASDYEAWPRLLGLVAARSSWDNAIRWLDKWEDDREQTWVLMSGLARAGSAQALQILVQQWGDHDDTQELISGLARAGSAQALQILVQQWGDHDDTQELISGLARAGSAQALQILVQQWGDHDDTQELISGLARAGSAQALQIFVQRRGNYGDISKLIGDLDDEAIGRLAQGGSTQVIQILARWWGDRDDIRELISRLARAGSAQAVQVLVWCDDRGDTQKLISRLAQEGSTQAVEVLAQRWGDRDDTRQLISRLAQEGSPQAVEVLVQRWGDDDDTWKLIGGLDDEAIGRLARGSSALAVEVLVQRWGDRDDTRELISRLAQGGSPRAAEVLAHRWGDRDDTRQLISRLAQEGSAQAVQILIQQWGDHGDTWKLIRGLDDEFIGDLAQEDSAQAVQLLMQQWSNRDGIRELISRLAQAGSAQAVRILVQRWGDHDGTWTLLSHLAQSGSAEVSALVAWRDWAMATAGPRGLADLCAGGLEVPPFEQTLGTI
jgi:hypothetical protein